MVQAPRHSSARQRIAQDARAQHSSERSTASDDERPHGSGHALRQAPRPPPAIYNKSTTYVSLIMGDGDNIESNHVESNNIMATARRA
jgi:hypothetical protein